MFSLGFLATMIRRFRAGTNHVQYSDQHVEAGGCVSNLRKRMLNRRIFVQVFEWITSTQHHEPRVQNRECSAAPVARP